MGDREDNDVLPVLAGVALGFGLGRATGGSGFRRFRRGRGFRITPRVTIEQLIDGNWDIDPYRAQLPKVGSGPVNVNWVLQQSTIDDGYSFAPRDGIVFVNAGNEFYNPVLVSPGVFQLTARNVVPEVEFKYTINLWKDGKPHFSIDPSYKNGPHG